MAEPPAPSVEPWQYDEHELPGLTDEAYLGPLRAMHPKVIAAGEHDPNVEDSKRLAGLLRDKGVQVGLEIWPGWAHDWPYWKEMMRRYVADTT